MQPSSSPTTIQQTARFSNPFGLCIWQQLRQGTFEADVGQDQLWVLAAEELAAQANWHSLQLHTQQLNDLACLPASAHMPENIALTAKDNLLPSCSEVAISMLPLLLLVQTCMQSACMLKDGVSPESCLALAPDVMVGSMTKARLQLKPMVQDNATESSCYIRKLRASFLLLKLESVMSTTSMKKLQLQQAVTAVWTAFGTMALSIQQEAEDNKLQKCEVDEAHSLSLHIVKLAIAAARQAVKINMSGAYCSCLMLHQLLVSSTPAVYHCLAFELITAGDPVLHCFAVSPPSAQCCIACQLISTHLTMCVQADWNLLAYADSLQC